MSANASAKSLLIRQLIARDGKVELVDVELAPMPAHHVRVRTQFSGISAGTELNLIARSGGTGAAAESLGYQLCGEIEAVSEELRDDFRIGQLVACYGGPYVRHASAVNVPRNLSVPLPDGTDPVEAAFGGLGTIALHAFRCSGLTIGENAAVIGLGMLGNLLAQIARAAGCRTSAYDVSEVRRRLAGQVGISALASVDELRDLSPAADAVFLAASNIDEQTLGAAIEMLRIRGSLVIVGTTLPETPLPREALFQKEAKLIVSRAGGPGRYDPNYESAGQDYPLAYVRWTEGRNLEHVVRMLSEGVLRIRPLVSAVLPPSPEAYEALRDSTGRGLSVALDWRQTK